MIAAFINGYGSNQTLNVGKMPNPPCGPNDVLVRIHAASLNPVDFKVRDGMVRMLRRYRFPLILGHDCAGEVIEIGAQVSRFKIGDRVFSRPRNGRIGTLAELIAIDQGEVALMPANLTYEDAASLPLVGLTSWQALVDIAHLKPQQRILIQAGSGGIGTFAIQLAKYLGAEVWTTTSGKNVDFVKSLGADHVINYQQGNFAEQVSEMDVVFDTLGGTSLDKSLAVTRAGGWVVSISGSPDHRTARDMNLGTVKSLLLRIAGLRINLKAKNAGVNYRFIFMRSLGNELAEIANLVAKGFIRPVIDKTFLLSDSQTAIEYLQTGRARGKVVVRVIA